MASRSRCGACEAGRAPAGQIGAGSRNPQAWHRNLPALARSASESSVSANATTIRPTHGGLFSRSWSTYRALPLRPQYSRCPLRVHPTHDGCCSDGLVARFRTIPKQHDLWPVKNLKDFQILSPRAEAVGMLDQSRSDHSVRADRTACAGWEHQNPDRARVRPCRTLRLTNANRDPSSLSATKQPLRQRLAQPARESATVLLAGSAPDRYGAEIINTVAGRLLLSSECPAHPKGLVSLGLVAPRPPRPTVGGHVVWGQHGRLGIAYVDWSGPETLYKCESPIRVS